jgi:uncharacterized protein (TIGR02271 family)
VNETGDGGGERRPRSEPEDATLILHEERARIETTPEYAGSLHARREVVRERVRADYPRRRERLATDRVPVSEEDSGKIETLPDGSISIPLFEEKLVVTRQTVLRERVIIRKERVTDWQTVEADLRKERVRFDTEDVPEGTVEKGRGLRWRPRRR